MIEDYFRQVAALIAGTSIVHSSSITYDKRSSYIGLIRGDIYFFDGSRLHIREFVNVQQGLIAICTPIIINVQMAAWSFDTTTRLTSHLWRRFLTTSTKATKGTWWRPLRPISRLF